MNSLISQLVLDSLNTDSNVIDSDENLLSKDENLDLVLDAKKYTITPDEGYLIAEAIVSKAGVYDYGMRGKVAKLPEDLYNQTSLDALQGLEMVLEHPPTATNLIDVHTAKYYTVGHVIDKPVVLDNQGIKVKFKITDKEAINQILNGNKKYISLGSKADWIQVSGVFDSKEYVMKQINFRHNHIAITSNPRVQDAKIILDSKKEVKRMALVKLSNNVSIEVNDKDVAVLDSFIKENDKNIADLSKEKVDLSAKVSTLEGKIAVLDSKEDIEKKINEGVNYKLSIVDKAKKIAKNVVIDSLPIEIMKNAIKEARPSLDLANKDENYVSGVFDSLVETVGSQQPNNSQQSTPIDIRTLMTTSTVTDSKEVDLVEQARLKMIENSNNAWKKQAKGV